MLMLGIETSCDETSVAVVQDGLRVRSNIIASSKRSFERLAGVIPEQAARQQVECMMPVLRAALEDAGAAPSDLDAVAVTRGPGLLGSLLVGTVAARAVASVWKKPVIGVHHTLGHLSSTWLDLAEEPQFPILTLSASGGHTDLWLRTSHLRGRLLGRTRDDAAGEAFDKGASMLGLPYPGGPAIAKAAEHGDYHAYEFPQPLRGDETLEYSFSGLKTALKYLLRDLDFDPSRTPNTESRIPNLAASFQHAICAHLVSRVTRALALHPDIREVHVVGGVSANTHLRSLLANTCGSRVIVRTPATLAYCTDNAAMIAAAGEFMVRELGDRAYGPFRTEASLTLAGVVHE